MVDITVISFVTFISGVGVFNLSSWAMLLKTSYLWKFIHYFKCRSSFVSQYINLFLFPQTFFSIPFFPNWHGKNYNEFVPYISDLALEYTRYGCPILISFNSEKKKYIAFFLAKHAYGLEMASVIYSCQSMNEMGLRIFYTSLCRSAVSRSLFV